MNELLKSVVLALDSISVSGRYNRDTLSNCISALESIERALSAPTETETEEKEETDG